jgi:hypothetical protein
MANGSSGGASKILDDRYEPALDILASGDGRPDTRISTRRRFMTMISVPVGPPYGTIPVNTKLICAAVPDPVSPDTASNLLIDSAGGRSITALVKIREVGKMLGGDFAEFIQADQARSVCFVNRAAWVSVVPHPQVERVSQINFANRRYLPVTGTVDKVIERLEKASAARSARRSRVR